MADPYFSIVIPVYNEEKRIGSTLLSINQYINTQPFSSEVIIVDDGSTDKTIDVVNKTMAGLNFILLKNPNNMGKGASVKKGMLAAKGRFVLFSDADLSTPIYEATKFLSLLDKSGYQCVIGSRALDRSLIEVHQNVFRELMGRVFNCFARLLSFHDIQDSQCGFKMFERNVAQDLFGAQRLDGFAFDAEILYLAQKKGYKIKEVPVVWSNSEQSRVQMLLDPAKMFIDLLKIRWIHRKAT